MQDEKMRSLGGRGQKVDVHEVAVGGIPALPEQRRALHRAPQSGKERLRMGRVE
jgi:hypothetical protein